MGTNQYWAGRVYDMCVYYMTGTPEGSTESGFMEKPGILVNDTFKQASGLFVVNGLRFKFGSSRNFLSTMQT